jgi:hypothetical protein
VIDTISACWIRLAAAERHAVGIIKQSFSA